MIKVIDATINLPIESVCQVVDIDDPRGFVNVDDIKFDNNFSVNSLNAYIEPTTNSLVLSEKGECVLFGFKKKQIHLYEDLQFIRLELVFAGDRTMSFIVPSYVRFYVKNKNTFISVVNLGKSDILLDNCGQMVRIKKIETIDPKSIKMTYISICAKYVLDDQLEFATNFYLNGVLASVPWRNFSGKKNTVNE